MHGRLDHAHFKVPQVQGAVTTRRGKHLGVGREAQRANQPLVSLKRAAQLAVLNIPDSPVRGSPTKELSLGDDAQVRDRFTDPLDSL